MKYIEYPVHGPPPGGIYLRKAGTNILISVSVNLSGEVLTEADVGRVNAELRRILIAALEKEDPLP